MSEDIRRIHDGLTAFNEDKWGWVIYRTTYKDDAAWERFKDYVNVYTRDCLSNEADAPARVVQGLEWTFVSDPTTLDGATLDQLRDRFRSWRKVAVAAENPRRQISPLVPGPGLSQRYLFFVVVDEESLRSVVESAGPRKSLTDAGWVNFVRCFDEYDNAVDRAPDEEDDGWMMISACMIDPSFYDGINTFIEFWDGFYMAPPAVVFW